LEAMALRHLRMQTVSSFKALECETFFDNSQSRLCIGLALVLL
jgi:hypothetical protein